MDTGGWPGTFTGLAGGCVDSGFARGGIRVKVGALKRRVTGVVLLVALALAGAAWWFRAPLWEKWATWSTPLSLSPAKPRPQPEKYATLVAECGRWRQRLAVDYRKAGSQAERAKVLQEARVFLETALPEMMRCWLGTPWDFHGTAEQPGTKGIACGYFVVTILRDAGFRVERVRLSQQASQTILRTFVAKDQTLLRVGVPYETFAAEVKALPPGVHVVGLDSHVGFLVLRDGDFRFVHSSGQKPWCVVDEGETDAGCLRASNYRVMGNLTADPEVARKWLSGSRLAVGGS